MMNQQVGELARDTATAVSATSSLPEHYVEPQTSLVGRTLRTLKHGNAFAVLDAYGDIGTRKDSPEGLYYHDTRFLSHLELRMEARRPLLLSSVIQDDNAALSVDLANPDFHFDDGRGTLPRDAIHLDRTKFIWQGVAYERIGLRNFDTISRRFSLHLRFDADFHDLFEVRGEHRAKRGRRSIAVNGPDSVEYRYAGLDGVTRRTILRFDPAPAKLDEHRATFDVALEADEASSIFMTVVCDDADTHSSTDFFLAYRDTRRSLRAHAAHSAKLDTSNDLFNEVVARARSDLAMLLTKTPHGTYPYAGIPWYSTVFGRDGIITAMEMLWADPSVARGVLQYLSATQATAVDPEADAQPGKILHERRHGEMARLGEVPFRFYYGTVDATPLYLMLAGQYAERTGDLDFVREIWPHVEAALRWIDDYGDMDGDGFVEYHRQTEQGLANQGWKDSYDSIFHADGQLATGPIALCEVQGYVYAAKRGIARIAERLGHGDLAKRLNAEAERLRKRFDEAFWCEEIGTYALALDGTKTPCRVRASNAGHALFTGIADPERAERVVRTLMSQESFSGWGIRTVARGEARYNPMSYHNGSIWPHDNALIALGFSRYGFRDEAARIFHALFDAARHQDLHRLPELFCGFIRRRHRGPTAYPVACSPQAWAAVAPYALMEAVLGLAIDVERNEIRFDDPYLPDFLDEVTLRGLRLDGTCLNILAYRKGREVVVTELFREGDARLIAPTG